jgi:hypothetical protein
MEDEDEELGVLGSGIVHGILVLARKCFLDEDFRRLAFYESILC